MLLYLLLYQKLMYKFVEIDLSKVLVYIYIYYMVLPNMAYEHNTLILLLNLDSLDCKMTHQQFVLSLIFPFFYTF